MRQIRISIAAAGVASAIVLGAPNEAGAWESGWVPVYEDYARGWGTTRPFWWGELGPTPYWGGTSFDSSLGWPYNTWYGPASTYTYRVAPARPYYAESPGEVVSARSVVTAGLGLHCATEVKTCRLRQASVLGGGCTCKVTGGFARGSVGP
jgi:hypothetical protein